MRLKLSRKFNPKKGILYTLFFVLPALSPLMLIKGGKLLTNDIILFFFSVILIILYGFRFKIKELLFLGIFLLTAIPGIEIHGLSWLRFAFYFIISLVFVDHFRDGTYINKVYRNAVVFYSIWVVLTYVLATFNININLDFGEYQSYRNVGSVENIGNYNLSEIRMAGGFREPGWFAIFVCLYLVIEKKLLSFSFIICAIALILSASTFGLIILGLKVFNSFRYLLTKRIIYILIIIIAVIVPFYINSAIEKFDRLINIFDPEKSSLYIRVVDPLIGIVENVQFFPYVLNAEFPNTFAVFFTYFGAFFGLLLLLLLCYYTKFKFLFFIFLLAILNEGFYGRVEFILLLIIMLTNKPPKPIKVCNVRAS